MKQLSIPIIFLLMVLSTAAWAKETPNYGEPFRAQLEVPQPAEALVNRGPDFTQSVGHRDLNVTYRSHGFGVDWAQINTHGWSSGGRTLGVSVVPTLLVLNDGKLGAGAVVSARLSDVVQLTHTSHFGGAQRHITAVSLAPKSSVSLDVLRVAGAGGSQTRVGPAVKLTKNLRLWYGVGLGDSSNLVLVNGNIRF